VPIHDIEKLANVESRLGEQRAHAEFAVGKRAKGGPRTAEALIDMALKRLDGLDALVETRFATVPVAGADGAALPLSVVPHGERAALRGSALKRKAALQARRLLTQHLSEVDKDVARREMTDSLDRAIAAYRSAEGSPGSSRFSPYHALNRLALDALTDWASPAGRDAAIELAQQCRRAAAQGFAINPSLWDAVTQPEALLVEHLIDGSFGRAGDAGRAVFEEVARAYADAMLNVTVKPSQIDTMVSQMELLSRLCDALALVQFDDEALARTAARLVELVQRLQPGRAARDDRPHAAPEAPKAASSVQRKPAAKKATPRPAAKKAAKKRARPAAKPR
jgi:hypothetical protein